MTDEELMASGFNDVEPDTRRGARKKKADSSNPMTIALIKCMLLKFPAIKNMVIIDDQLPTCIRVTASDPDTGISNHAVKLPTARPDKVRLGLFACGQPTCGVSRRRNSGSSTSCSPIWRETAASASCRSRRRTPGSSTC